MNKLLLLVLVVLTVAMRQTARAHQDFIITKKYDNVNVRIVTGYNYEEIQKVTIIGKLASALCKELNYTEPVLLDFVHSYTEYIRPSFFLSYDSLRKYGVFNSHSGTYGGKCVIVRQHARQLSPLATLKMLLYAINSKEQISHREQNISLIDKVDGDDYCHFCLSKNRIDTVIADSVINSDNTIEINSVLDKEMYPDRRSKGITYFYKNDRYNIVFRNSKQQGRQLLILDNIYQFEQMSPNDAIVFDTDSSFYYLQSNDGNTTPHKYVLRQTSEYYKPFIIEKNWKNKLTISYSRLVYAPVRKFITVSKVYRIDAGKLIEVDNAIADNTRN